MNLTELLEEFKLKKVNNTPLNWEEYKKRNLDLSNANIIEHWFKHGKHENRCYSDLNKELSTNWLEIVKYLHTNDLKYDSWAFIITTCVRNKVHLEYLKQCIRHIRYFYPKIHIYLINDSSTIPIDITSSETLEIIQPIVPAAGELNPYLFAMTPECKHEKLVYIHDTVFLKKKIDTYLQRTREIDFLWYDVSAIHHDTIRIENTNILNNLFFYVSNTKISAYNLMRYMKNQKIGFTVKFGCMSVFTKRFAQKLDLVTNIREVAVHFKNRVNRSFFERLLSIFHYFIYRYDHPIGESLCGNIMNHPHAFGNTNVNIPSNGSFVKVWQGR
jgi:hypothetical protein